MGWFSKKNETEEVAMVPVAVVVRALQQAADFHPDERGAQALREMAIVFQASEDPIGDEWAEYPPPE